MNGKLRRAVLSSDPTAVRNAISGLVNLDQADEQCMTPLLYAIYRGDLEVTKLLLECGADSNFNPTASDPSHAN